MQLKAAHKTMHITQQTNMKMQELSQYAFQRPKTALYNKLESFSKYEIERGLWLNPDINGTSC